MIVHKISGPEKGEEDSHVGIDWVGHRIPNTLSLSAARCVEEKADIIFISFHGTRNNSRGLLQGGRVSIPLAPHLMQRRIFITPRPKVQLLTGSFLTSPTALPFWHNVLVALEEERKGLPYPGRVGKQESIPGFSFGIDV